MTVVPFAKPQKESWLSGYGICVGCRHEWAGAWPTGTWQLECPSCGSMKGIGKHPVGPDESDAGFRCSCGCEAMTAYKRRGRLFLRCMHCGTDQTMALWEG